VKDSTDRWIKFDDETVSIVNEEEIKKLSGKGGGDWHIAYLCMYRTRPGL
jgi:ubiquitin carboxyl-terminal hydrolase 14